MPLITNPVIIGQSPVESQNFRLQSGNDGTLTLARKSDGSGGNILTVDINGKVGLPQQTVSASSANTVTNKVAIVIGGTTYYLLASTSGG